MLQGGSQAMMADPMFQQFLNNPEMMRTMIQSNPMIREVSSTSWHRRGFGAHIGVWKLAVSCVWGEIMLSLVYKMYTVTLWCTGQAACDCTRGSSRSLDWR